ncbi:MAG: gephyrin-like molybdotransferase Glp [Betaproteobacteria bacterium]|jgi:molybdopterin molybdotransferase
MSRPPLMSLEQALEIVISQAHDAPMKAEEVSCFEADGRVLLTDLIAPLEVPARDNSAMDGYAIKVADSIVPNATLQVTQRIPAGTTGQTLLVGQAARIFTGAWIPDGADAVVMQEDCLLDGEQLQLQKPVLKGQWIRKQGEDVKLGQTVLKAGERLNPASLGLAASIGQDRLWVAKKPRVALFSTGDELVMPGEVEPKDMKPGSIYNSNRFFLRSLLIRLGCEVTDMGIVPDDQESTMDALSFAAQGHDLILTSGGVSVGEEDHVKPSVQALGALNLWSLSMKPGKPFALGHINAAGQSSLKTHFMGLPGNPVSSFVTFLVLVRPFLLALQCASHLLPKIQTLPAHFELPKADARREFLRVKKNDQGGLDLFKNQSSGVLTSCVWADGLLDNPSQQTIKYGQMVSYLSFSELLT